MNHCTPKLLAVLTVAGTILVGCKPEPTANQQAEIDRLTAELADAKQKLAVTTTVDDPVKKEAAAVAATEVAKRETVDKERDKQLALKDAELKALQAEVAALKRSDAIVYSAASAQQSGTSAAALERYQKFVQDFPDSPLVNDANRAIAELQPIVSKDAQYRASLIDPRRADLDLLKRFADGIVTAPELGPLVKGRRASEVVKLLGTPTRTYRNGTEIGYEDKIIDTTTGNRATLVITFEDDRATTMRVGYQGRDIKL